MKSKAAFVLLALMCMGQTTDSFALSVQNPHPVNVSSSNAFGSFRLHRQGKNISLNWTMIFPRDVAYYSIQRSYDGEFYEVIDELEGSGSSRSKYLDEQVYPGYIHYRIVAFLNDGSIVESAVETIRIVSRK